MLKKIAIGLIIIVALILGLAATKPDNFTVQRATTIKAPPEKIMALISDFHNWPAWSPWEMLDPNMNRTFSGAANGKGATYHWKGNSDVGSGRMEITDYVAPTSVTIKLDFIEPIAMSNMTQFVLTPKGDTTTVTWNMNGPMPFLTKVMSVFSSMDAMIAPDFEKGLAQLKAAAEK
ncbi:MAG: SRPBCC family protein [Telluria sp.]